MSEVKPKAERVHGRKAPYSFPKISGGGAQSTRLWNRKEGLRDPTALAFLEVMVLSQRKTPGPWCHFAFATANNFAVASGA
jgi:hypothetical protein